MEGWIEIKECPYCQNELTFYDAVDTAPTFGVEFCNGYLPVVTPSSFSQCVGCGLVMQSPRMTDERIDYYYSSGLYRQTLGLSTEYMDADETRRAKEVASWLNIHPDSHLDIGASRGDLLMLIDAKIKHGFDSNPSYSNTMQVFSNKEHLQTYDLVTSVHCLEHVTDPISELAWYKSLTKDLLYIEVPGKNCKGGALRFAHLFYFPPQLLKEMLESIGLTVLQMETEPNTRILCKK